MHEPPCLELYAAGFDPRLGRKQRRSWALTACSRTGSCPEHAFRRADAHSFCAPRAPRTSPLPSRHPCLPGCALNSILIPYACLSLGPPRPHSSLSRCCCWPVFHLERGDCPSRHYLRQWRCGAPSQLMSCTTAIRQEGAQRLIFHQPLRFGVRTPCDQVQASSGLSESCPKNGDVPKSPFPCSGSPGAVGRHNNT
jgi:hypothetical protein